MRKCGNVLGKYYSNSMYIYFFFLFSFSFLNSFLFRASSLSLFPFVAVPYVVKKIKHVLMRRRNQIQPIIRKKKSYDPVNKDPLNKPTQGTART